MNVTRHPLAYYVDLLNTGAPFSFVRYGDGEWNAMLKEAGKNCDGHEYFPDLGHDLRLAVTAQRSYFYAIGPKATGMENMQRWLKRKKVADMEWHDTEVWLNASVAGELYPLIRALRERHVFYIGPAHLQDLAWDWFGAEFIEIPAVNAYLSKMEILRKIHRGIVRYGQPDVIAFSAGMTTNVLIDVLYQSYGDVLTMLDFGSVFDVYAGVKSRSYMRSERFDWQKLGQVNRYG